MLARMPLATQYITASTSHDGFNLDPVCKLMQQFLMVILGVWFERKSFSITRDVVPFKTKARWKAGYSFDEQFFCQGFLHLQLASNNMPVRFIISALASIQITNCVDVIYIRKQLPNWAWPIGINLWPIAVFYKVDIKKC